MDVYCVMREEARTDLEHVVFATTNKNDAERFAREHNFIDYDGNPNIEVLDVTESENEQIIRIKKGTLKARTGRYVVYDVEWLKTHFNTTEAALYGQPYGDCISRKEVFKALHSKFADGFDGDKWWNSTYVLAAINEVPSVTPPQPTKHTEERTETHACDCISREAVLNLVADYNLSMGQVVRGIHNLPSVNPQPKTGHWEWIQYESKPNFGNWHCSKCRHILCGAIKGNRVKLPKYCEECGSYNGGDNNERV